jgi:hypothetical protein
MTTVSLESVGLCAHLSATGDRAFRYALSLAKTKGLQLNIFSFLRSPFSSGDAERPPERMPRTERQNRVDETDREMRFYYEDRLGDFVDVGFRVCEGHENVELRRCLRRREYETLIVPYLERGGLFGQLSFEDFANRFAAPIVLVGPWRRTRYWLNPPAVLIADRLCLHDGAWRALPKTGEIRDAS